MNAGIIWQRLALGIGLAAAAATGAQAAKATRLWNLTSNTITKLQLAPEGTTTFGPDQCKNDKDGSVDHDERLKLLGVSTGKYDIRFSDAKGRSCLVKNVPVKEGDVVTLDEKQLGDACGK
jgi:hypothetical protein